MARILTDLNVNSAFSFKWSGYWMLSWICFVFNYHFCKIICPIKVLCLMPYRLFYKNCSAIMVEIKLLLSLSPTQSSVRRLSLLGRLIHSHLWDGLSHRCLALNSSFLPVDGITCLLYRFKAEETIYRMVYHTYRLYRFLGYKSIYTA
jgi:hypothetical protein